MCEKILVQKPKNTKQCSKWHCISTKPCEITMYTI